MAGKGRNKKVIFPVFIRDVLLPSTFYATSRKIHSVELRSASFVNYAVVSTNSPLINIRAISFRNFTTRI